MKLGKIISKKDKVLARSKLQMICTGTKGKGHCITHCFHGVPHDKESERDACHLTSEICVEHKPKIVKITCRKLTKTERKLWIKEEMAK